MSIKDLRTRTQAGLADCKKAWEDSNGDMDAAIKLLRARGLAKAIKRSAMDTSAGAVVVGSKGKAYGMLFLGMETDFVAKNDEFCKFANDILDEFLTSEVNDIQDLQKDGVSFETRLQQLAGVIGENLVLRGAYKTQLNEESAYIYLHNKLNDNFSNVGTIGAFVKVKGNVDSEILKILAIHVASFKPVAIARDELDPEWIELQKKEAEVAGESIEARIRSSILSEQPFLMDPSVNFIQYCKNQGIDFSGFKIFFAS